MKDSEKKKIIKKKFRMKFTLQIINIRKHICISYDYWLLIIYIYYWLLVLNDNFFFFQFFHFINWSFLNHRLIFFRYRALYNYRPQNEDELELKEGDTVYVMEKCDDGWYVGSSQRTGYFGTFPGNYVEQLWKMTTSCIEPHIYILPKH